MLSASFWRDTSIVRKSDGFFHRASIFGSDTPFDSQRMYEDDRWDTFWEPMTILQPAVGNLTQDDQLMIKAWEEKENTWELARKNWFSQGRDLWCDSPWSYIAAKEQLYNFEKAFEKRDRFSCSRMIPEIRDMAPWQVNTQDFLTWLPPEAPDYLYEWMWHTIGLLQMAAIPIMTSPLETITPSETINYKYRPSREAQALGRRRKHWSRSVPETKQTIRPTYLIDSFSGIRKDQGIKQSDFLDLAAKVITHIIRNNVAVPQDWIMEIQRVAASLRTQRLTIEKKFPKAHRRQWAQTWDFKIPTYSQDLRRRLWNGTAWTDVPVP
ncbi:hypothetical protein GGR57DRAFT_500984 [Xylariaceae sp. FL1272]|nr:hypothetical protein GGR57DRAFT_500984 [Xylariaceae sp. FL1272]